MGTLERREPRGILPDLFDWLESPFSLWRGGDGHTMRVENYVENGDHVIRAELPGIDPDKDVDITVSGGILRISAERREEKKEGRRTEFHYGSFTRSFTLPSDVNVDDIKASYDKGILTVRVPMAKPAAAETKKIPVHT
ncbi:MAG TPA: Hsp20/alpha crystallin family protein [Spirillospora sp.]